MSTTRFYGKVAFECDGCGDSIETTDADFQAAVDHIKSEGWEPRKRGEAWSHFCPDCKDERP